jgi:hypothetical protein
MTPPPAEAIFDLPFPNVKDISSLNDILAPAVARALPREEASPKRRIVDTDGPVLSQYARVMGVRRMTLRTFNIDLLLWFSAGLDSPLEVALDPRIPPVLAAANVNLAGNFTLRPGDDTPPDGSAIFADRMDIIAFAEALCDDILSGRHAYLVIYDVIDVPARQFIEAARQSGLGVEVVPGPRSYAVFHLGGADGRGTVERLLRTYVEQTKMAPQYLGPRLRDKTTLPLLTGAFTELLIRTRDACASLNRTFGVSTAWPKPPTQESGLRGTALALAGEFCAILDPKNNPIAAIGGREYRESAEAVCNRLRQSPQDEGNFARVRNPVLESYGLLWKFFHLVASWSTHSLAENETFHLALERSTQCVIAPKAFKPFREYIFTYRFKDFGMRKKNAKGTARGFSRALLAGSMNHVVRKWQLIGLIEMLFTILRRERPNETIRWLDLGCGGRACAANCVRVEDYLPDENWEIVGVDWNESALEAAKLGAGPHRTFLLGDVKEAVNHIGGGRFNVVSGFEFVEHLEDPVKTLKEYAPLCSDFFVAGSPLGEQQGWLPSAEHVWTFDRKGYEATLDAAGLAPVFANEAYVGKFSRGHDWVTVIGATDRKLPNWIEIND